MRRGQRLRATGSTVASPGYLAVYEDAAPPPGPPVDASASAAGEAAPAVDGKAPRTVRLPKLSKGQVVTVSDIRAEQHFTRPPPRYTEATLVRELERCGIGRPSTYADIISKLQQRGYVELEKRRFHPTDVGRVVSRFLTEHFSRYVDYGFTASLEDDLDAISEGRKAWVPVLDEFWRDFEGQVRLKQETVTRQQVTQQRIDETCPECGRPLAIRLGRNGNFISCTGFPECRYARNLPRGDEDEAAEGTAGGREPKVLEGRECPKCGGPLVEKSGRSGKFAGCAATPIAGTPSHSRSCAKRTSVARCAARGPCGSAARAAASRSSPARPTRSATTRRGTSRSTSPALAATGRSSPSSTPGEEGTRRCARSANAGTASRPRSPGRRFPKPADCTLPEREPKT